jgi:(4-O-methyl)-D-glucuronate---lignin esterase
VTRLPARVTRLCFTLFILLSLSACGVTDAVKALWTFTQDYPHASPLILLDLNENESKVPEYDLPPLLRSVTGESMTSPEEWESNRPALQAQFAEHIYGQTPSETIPVTSRMIESPTAIKGGPVVRKQVELDIGGHKVAVLIYVPGNAQQPVPAFLALNFRGNHTVSNDKALMLPASWVPIDEDHGVLSHSATDANRGQRARRWPVETIVARGYALVTAYYGDIYPDHVEGRANSVHTLFEPDETWGAIGAWSWGLSRILDYLKTDEHIDAARVVSLGHSRLGKAALWAAAQDQRFAAAISNNSGAVGAALSRRQFGETVNIITAMFPHWFTADFAEFAKRESSLPVDQHQFIALLAPRPVYVASASKDLWADPRGEFLSARAASEVYRLYGMATATFSDMPPPGGSISGPVSYHLREGKHDMVRFDWDHYLDFADCYLLSEISCP